MILRQMPDLAPSNDAFRSWFFSRWGRENCIVLGRTCSAEYSPKAVTLSIKATWGGREEFEVANRRLTVDDDNFLILNGGQRYAARIRADRQVESFAIFFRPGLAQEVLGSLVMPLARALDRLDHRAPHDVEFPQHLQPHDRMITPVLHYIRHHVRIGHDDEAWYEEQLYFLLERMLAHNRREAESLEQLEYTRVAARDEIHRRIAIATDFLHSNYEQEISLQDLAGIACLSKFHFLRLFKTIHGLTPHQYLQRKRAFVARRLMDTRSLTVGEIAARVGYRDRSSVSRQIRRWIRPDRSATTFRARP